MAPGALETGHAPLPQLSGTMVPLQLLLTRVPTVSRWQSLAFHNQFYREKKSTLSLPVQSGPKPGLNCLSRKTQGKEPGRHWHKESLEIRKWSNRNMGQVAGRESAIGTIQPLH